MRPWYVRRVEGFLKARRPASLSQVMAEEIAGYLQEESAQAQLANWQFRQLVDALQLLFLDLAQCPAGKAIDWDWCKAGGPDAGGSPPTVRSDGRDLRPDDAPDVRHRNAADGVHPVAGG